MNYLLPIIAGLIFMAIPRSLQKSVSPNGIKQLKFLEGERLDVYLDQANIPTVGVGHKVLQSDNLNVGDTITQTRSDQFLTRDLLTAKKTVNNYVNVPLNQNQFDALVSFVFNIGVDKFRRSTLLNRLNDYDYQGALAEFSRWKYATDQGTGAKIELPGLVNRRRYEQDLFNA